jgi:hypothetical protein
MTGVVGARSSIGGRDSLIYVYKEMKYRGHQFGHLANPGGYIEIYLAG